MAKNKTTDSVGTYVIVEKGDTLSGICQTYLGDGSATMYNKIAALNGISNPNKIVVGQKIYISKKSTSSGGSSSTSSTTNSASQDLKILDLGELSNTEGVLYAAWSCGLSNIDHYEYKWSYATGDGYGFIDKEESTKYKNCQYTIPSQAYKVTIAVKPVSKTYGEKNDKVHWTKNWVQKEYYCVDNIIGEVGAPTATMDGNKLTAELSGVDLKELNATGIEFEVVLTTGGAYAPIYSGRRSLRSDEYTAMFRQTVSAGGSYKVRCRAYRTWGGKDYYGEWSDYSNEVHSAPTAPTITSIEVDELTINDKEQRVLLTWTSVSNADNYEIQYAINAKYFDSSDIVDSKTTPENNNSWYIDGLATGKTHHFRVRAIKGESHSDWSQPKSIKLGLTATMPTTWSSSTRVVVDEDKDLYLYWVHNCEDGSSQKAAKFALFKNGSTVPAIQDMILTTGNTPEGTVEYFDAGGKVSFTHPRAVKEGESATYYLKIDTSWFKDGTTSLEWHVQTKGWGGDFSEWSTKRKIDICPAVSLSTQLWSKGAVTNTIRQFPFQLKAIASGGGGVNAIGYHVEVVSKESYETVDNVGSNKTIRAGETIYSKYFDVDTNTLIVDFSAHNIDLQDGIDYKVTTTVTMATGVSKQSTNHFSVSWDEPSYIPNAEITIDKQKLVAYIKPYVENYTYEYYKVEKSSNKYIAKTTKVDIVGGRELEGIYTTNGKQVCEGVLANGEDLTYYYEVRNGSLRANTLLSVYRREYDGTFTEIETDIDNSKNTCVTDPHPSLDYARYRIVAKDSTIDGSGTGSISYYDVPGVPVDEHAVVIQWGDSWTTFDDTYEDLETGEIKTIADDPMHAWNGSMLKLPYNIDVAPKINKEVSLVNYIGRKQPVVYYGTYLNETATWNVEIPKQNTATLYALRKLAIWMDKVYVREPSGTGYWADISVTFPQKHCEVTIPVTFDIARVEGGA